MAICLNPCSFFGLKYCVEPTPPRTAADVSAHLTSKKPSTSGNNVTSKKTKSDNRKTTARARENEKQTKDTAFMQPILRATINENLFLSDLELPRHIEFDHILGMTVAVLTSFFAEECFLCFFPESKAIASQIQWFAALIVAVSLVELAQISVSVSSISFCVVCGVIGFVFALGIIANGDSTSFLLLDSAFANLKTYCEYILVERLAYGESDSAQFASRISFWSRFGCAVMAGLLSACLATPARKFARIDFDLYKRYRQEDADLQNDPYALSKPSHWIVLALSLDHVIPLIALSSFTFGRSNDSSVPYPFARLILLLIAFAMRVGLARVRFQSYLDSAISAFRDHWRDGRGNERDSTQAEQRLRIRVVSTYYFLPTIGCLYVCSPIVGMMWALAAKRSGSVGFGLCRMPISIPDHSLHVAAREVFGFFAWYTMAVYSFFSITSIALDVLMYYIDGRLDDSTPMSGTPGSGSQRRRLRRTQAGGGH